MQTVKHIARRTDEVARSSVDAQTRAMEEAARALFGTEVGPPCSGSSCRCSTWPQRVARPWERWLTHAATAAAASASSPGRRGPVRGAPAHAWSTRTVERGQPRAPAVALNARNGPADAAVQRVRAGQRSPTACDHGTHARVTVGNERVQVGTAPAQRVQAAQHVVADGDVDGAQLERVELEGLAVVGRREEAGDAGI